jgi:8-oxo-dGTP diphosphatase
MAPVLFTIHTKTNTGKVRGPVFPTLKRRAVPGNRKDYGMAGKKKYTYDYPRPAVTADAVVVTREAKPRVLLVRRKHDPFAGMWAIPGGFVDMEETLEQAARRELHEETGVEVEHLDQLHTFGDPRRDPRGRTISVVHLARADADQVRAKADDDAAEVAWYRLDKLPPLAFDHAQILECARRRLREKGLSPTAKAKKPQ